MRASWIWGPALWACVLPAAALGQAPLQTTFSEAERQALLERATHERFLQATDYQRLAELVFAHRRAADRAIAEAWQLRQQKQLTHSGYMHRREQAQDFARVAPAWERLRQGLFEGESAALRGLEAVLEQAAALGLRHDRRWGQERLREATRLLQRHRPPRQVADRDAEYVPLVTQREVDVRGAKHLIATQTTPQGLGGDELLGVADWWMQQPNEVRQLTNQILAERNPGAQRDLLRHLAREEIGRREEMSRRAPPPDDGWIRAYPPHVQVALHKLPQRTREAIRQGLSNLSRADRRDLRDLMSRMIYGDAPGSAIARALFNQAVPRNDSLGRATRNDLRLLDGSLGFNAHARITPRQLTDLTRRELDRARQEEEDRKWELIDSIQRIESDPGLRAHGQRLAKLWEVANRSELEKAKHTGIGALKQGADTVTGLATLLTTRPDKTLAGLYHVAKHPEILLVSLDDAAVDQDEFTGRLLFELGLAAATAGPKGSAVSAADKATDLARTAKVAENLADAGSTGRGLASADARGIVGFLADEDAARAANLLEEVGDAARHVDPQTTAQRLHESWIKHIDEDIGTPQLRAELQQHLRDAGVPEAIARRIDDVDADRLAQVTRSDPAALVRAARSRNPEVTRFVEDLLEKRKNYQIQDKDFRYLLNNAERLAELPAARQVQAIENASGGLGLTYRGRLPDGTDVFLKADKAMDYGTDEAVRVLEGLEPYGGPKYHGKVRVVDPETGFWREAVAMERIEGADLATLSRALERGEPLPFPVTQRHLDAVKQLERSLARDGKHLAETNLGDFILTPDPQRPLVPIDMFVEASGAKAPRHAGLLDHARKPILETVERLQGAPAKTPPAPAATRGPFARAAEGLPLDSLPRALYGGSVTGRGSELGRESERGRK